jgi:hypothetical protein
MNNRHSPSDEHAWLQIREGSYQVSSSGFLIISIIPGMGFRVHGLKSANSLLVAGITRRSPGGDDVCNT